MFFQRRYKRAMEVMRLRNKEYLDKMNSDNPDWDKEKSKAFPENSAAGAESVFSCMEESKAQADESHEAKQTAPAEGAEIENTSASDAKSPGMLAKKRAKRRKKLAGDTEESLDAITEKGDLPAIILSAFMVFGPIFLILILIMFLAWLILH